MVRCQFEVKEIKDGKEIIYQCPDEAEGIARCKEVCRFHFNKLKQDNMYRINKDVDIPEDTSLLMRHKIKWLHVKEKI